MKRHCFFGLIVSMMIALFLQSCSHAEMDEALNNPFDGVPEIEIGEPLDISNEEDAAIDDFYFVSSYFNHMAIDRNGHYFVSNRGGERTIFHFDEEGRYIGSIGSSGQGPGEFQSAPVFDIMSRDTLFVLDRVSVHVSRFVRRDGAWTYDDGFRVNRKEGYQPTKIYQFAHDLLAIEYSPDLGSLIAASNQSAQALKTFDLLAADGDIIKENWLTVPAHERTFYTSKQGATILRMLPYGAKSISGAGPGNRLYHLWTRNFLIRMYEPGGGVADSLHHQNYNPGLSDVIRQAAVNDNVGGASMNDPREQQALERQMYEEIPTTAPTLRDMHADRDSGLIIVRRYIFDDEPNWMLLDNKGRIAGVFTLDENMEVFDFRHGKIIGALRDENTLPAVRIVQLPSSAFLNND